MEQSGGNVRIHALLALAYDLGGVWGAAGLCGFTGALFFVWGLLQLSQRNALSNPNFSAQVMQHPVDARG
jgi:hypothetical protein